MNRKKRKNLFDNYDELLSGYYGFNKKTKKKISASFDHDEVIAQPLKAYGQSIEQEYVVEASSLPGEFEEEYVVEYSLSDDHEEEEEEYVIQSSIFNNDDGAINSFSYYSNDPTLSDQSAYNTPGERDQAYQTSILNPFSEDSSTNEEYETYIPLSLNDTNTYNSFDQDSNTNQFAPHNQTDSNASSNPHTQSAKEEELINDLQAILSGKKVYDSASGQTVARDQLGKQQSITKDTEKAKQPDPPENPHAIFDRIKENMQYANAYNLGTIPLNTNELEKRFNDLDALSQTEQKVNQTKKSIAQSQPNPTLPNKRLSKEMDFDPTEFLHDLEAIQKNTSTNSIEREDSLRTTASSFTVDIHSAAYPERPTTIRPYTVKEKIQIYGQFEYESDPSTFDGDGIKILNNWRETNIVNVSIPQLNGKKFGKQVIKNGTIAFHNLGADMLKKLWAAWESAGLLDKIMTFEGGYAARFIRGTQNRSPRPLSNHAWGTAFDINASWNGFSKEPALVGQTGCVRELVTIAHNNGFFWGGHFKGNKDGMHFELGKIL